MKTTERTYRHHRYETDPTYNADAYTMKGWAGIAWGILGWELVADDETEWTGQYNRTGELLAVMVGDDRVFHFSPDDVTALDSEEFCHGCGQIGCGH